MDPTANEIEAWVAALEDGTDARSDAYASTDDVAELAKSFTVRVKDRGEFTVACDRARGERLRVFTRRAIRHNGPRSTGGVAVNMPVLEVRRGEAFVRLYIHPEHGPIFSTLDLDL